MLEVFQTPSFSDADLIHISTHAQIDLAYPDLSRIILSGAADQLEYITPFDIRRIPLSAQTVFLAACETVGANSFEFENDLGFVSSFLNSGSSTVVASLWPVGDEASLVFMTEVYHRMGAGMSVMAAITETKRHLFRVFGQASINQSVAYQVFVG